MDFVLAIIAIHGILGTFDTLWNHEYLARLPKSPAAKTELLIHALRALLYGLTFIALGLFELHGAFAWLLIVILAAEVLLTLWDFVEEDRSRKLPSVERITHTVMAMTGGAFLAYLLPILYTWSTYQTTLKYVDRDFYGPLLVFFGCGAMVWSVKDLLAHFRMKSRVSQEQTV